MTAKTRPTRTYTPPEPLRLIFAGVLAFWLLVPVLLHGSLAQDALPYVVAGDLARDDPGLVYASQDGSLFELDPAFAARSCELAPPGTDCANLTVAFVSTPLSVPFALAVAALGATWASLLMRLMAAASLVVGMWVLWRRLAHRTPRAPAYLVATAVLLSPFTMVALSLGQTSPILFLSAMLGVRRAARTLWAPLLAAIWAAAIAFKAFPAALVVVLLWQRRWRMIAWSLLWGTLLVGLAVLSAPVSLWSDFATNSRELSEVAGSNPYNGSIGSLVHNVAAPVAASSIGSIAVLLVTLCLVAGLLTWAATRLEADAQWAYAYLLFLLLVPFVWWHYLWLAFSAVAAVLASRAKLDDRALVVLPVLAAVTVPISIPNSRGWSIPVAQGVFLLVTVALVPLLAKGWPNALERLRSDWRAGRDPSALRDR